MSFLSFQYNACNRVSNFLSKFCGEPVKNLLLQMRANNGFCDCSGWRNGFFSLVDTKNATTPNEIKPPYVRIMLYSGLEGMVIDPVGASMSSFSLVEWIAIWLEVKKLLLYDFVVNEHIKGTLNNV